MSTKNLLDFFNPIYRLKELFRQGWIGKVPSSEIESVAEHSFAVASLALVLVPIENELRKKSKKPMRMLDKASIVEKALIHDLPESQYLDLDKSFNSLLSPEEYLNFKTLLDTKAETKIQENFNSFSEAIFSLKKENILPSMNSYDTEEDKFVKLLDVIELYFQTSQYLSKKFISEEFADPFLDSTRTKIESFSGIFLISSLLR